MKTDNIKTSNWMYFTFSNDRYTTTYGTYKFATFDKNDVFDEPGYSTKYTECISKNGILNNNLHTIACDTCDRQGKIATIFLSLAFILIFPIVFISMCKNGKNRLQNDIVVVCLLLSILFIIISTASFSDCFDDMKESLDIDNNNTLAYGVGFICLSVNIFNCFLMFILHFFLIA